MSLRAKKNILHKAAAVGFSAVAFLAFSVSAHANLVTNGGFETTTNGPGQLGYNTSAAGWSTPAPNGSYNFIFASGTADTTGSPGEYGNLQLWGSNNGGIDVLPASSPASGNYVAADGAFQVGAISQTLTGLTIGDSYNVSFYWAGAQQAGFTGITTEQWQVSLGSQTQSTAIVTDPSHGFTGWMPQTFTYQATADTEVLSFLAAGTPNGEPPFSLLDGVSANLAPEPGYLIPVAGFMGLLFGLRFLKSKNLIKA